MLVDESPVVVSTEVLDVTTALFVVKVELEGPIWLAVTVLRDTSGVIEVVAVGPSELVVDEVADEAGSASRTDVVALLLVAEVVLGLW